MRTHLHLFIGRVAIICNVLFFYCELVRHTKDFIGNQDINANIIILGWGGAFLLNILFNGLWLFYSIRKIKVSVPKWILFTNLLVLVIQLAMILGRII